MPLESLILVPTEPLLQILVLGHVTNDPGPISSSVPDGVGVLAEDGDSSSAGCSIGCSREA